MAYQIDFTESVWTVRRWRKALLRLMVLAVLAGIAWGACSVYETYNEPTLNMRLAEYEMVSRPIEEMNAEWDAAAREYGDLVRYYRLVWAANPTNFLAGMAAPGAPRMRSGFRPRSWTLTTGGDCRLEYRYVFGSGDKAEETKGLEDEVMQSVTSVVQVVGGKVEVLGIRHENLLNVDELGVTVKFSLPDVRPFPAKERTLADCVREIAAMRKRVQETKLSDKSADRGMPVTAQGMMMAYLQLGKDKPDFPQFANVISISGWFDRADQFVKRHKMPGGGREQLRAAWNKVGEARYPWERFRALDNAEIVNRTKVLSLVSDGVKRFKGFLEKRRADNRKKLEPLVDAYAHNDVFNKPLVETDLKDRVAAAAGVSSVRVSFKDEPGVTPAVLVTADGRYDFTWVRWTLSVGAAAGKEDEKTQSGNEAASEVAVTTAMLSDCVSRALTLGPGYVLDRVKVDFGEDGAVSGAVLEGLLPVKKVESAKEKK